MTATAQTEAAAPSSVLSLLICLIPKVAVFSRQAQRHGVLLPQPPVLRPRSLWLTLSLPLLHPHLLPKLLLPLVFALEGSFFFFFSLYFLVSLSDLPLLLQTGLFPLCRLCYSFSYTPHSFLFLVPIFSSSLPFPPSSPALGSLCPGFFCLSLWLSPLWLLLALSGGFHSPFLPLFIHFLPLPSYLQLSQFCGEA